MLKSANTRGNVLFLILIAVALFGMLTAAITRSDRGATSMDRERGTISATDYMSYASAVEKTVARMIGQEMSENGLSFENDAWEYNNGDKVEVATLFTKCTTTSCQVFHPSGGGLEAKTFAPVVINDAAQTDVKPGHAGVYSLSVKGVGTAANDLVLLIEGVDQNTCKQINTQLNIPNPNGFPPVDAWASAPLYDGTFGGPGNATDQIGDSATVLERKAAGCVNRSGTGGKDDNVLYQVLIPR